MKHETDLAIANGRELVIIHFGNILAVKLITAGSRSIETTKHVHERRLAAAAWAHDGDIFVAANLQGHTAQSAHDFLAHHVLFGDILDIDHDRPQRSD